MIRTPNRGVAVAGAALGSVSLAVGVLGLGGVGSMASAHAAASSATIKIRSVSVAPTSDRTTAPVPTSALDDKAAAKAIAAERASLSGQAAAVAAAAGSTKTAKPKPKKKPRASRAKKRVPLTPREVARQLVADKGWKSAEFTCLDELWTRESGWNTHEENGGSGAYGIPQSLPGRKMASFGADWRDNPTTQIKWGLWYIAERYSTPCAAWEHSQRYNYY